MLKSTICKGILMTIVNYNDRYLIISRNNCKTSYLKPTPCFIIRIWILMVNGHRCKFKRYKFQISEISSLCRSKTNQIKGFKIKELTNWFRSGVFYLIWRCANFRFFFLHSISWYWVRTLVAFLGAKINDFLLKKAKEVSSSLAQYSNKLHTSYTESSIL